MSPRKTPTRPAHSLRFQRLACTALIGLFVGPLLTDRVCGAEEPADPYDVLYDVIMTRYGPDGKAYGANESSPSIFKESEFPFDDKTYKKFNAALDAFGALSQEKIEAYSDIQRALMQRHLWHVFDATIPYRWIQDKSGQAIWSMSHSSRRDAVRSKIASLIQRLALTKAQILALPDTKAVTAKSGGFSQRHDPKAPLKPFLSADLYSRESSWVGIGFDADPPAPFHQNKLKFRSAFLTFMQLPGGRTETLEYMARVRIKVEQFPVGTQFALIEQAFLISDEGEMILSPLIVSISLRAYLDVEQNFSRKRPPTQSLAEFVMQPRQLMQGNAVMKALGQRDLRYEAGDVDIHNEAVEPFEDVESVFFREDENDMLRRPRLTLCMECHKTRGRRGVRGGFFSDLKESSPEEIVKATLTYKRDHETWKTLSELRQADSAGGDAQSGARTDQPKQPLENATTKRDADATADPYDELYDLIMIRKDSEGIAFGGNEVGPAIYGRSRFPFDDETFPKLTAALDRFNALSQAEIKAYGNVKRALLQRQLWVVFDATLPPSDSRPPTHMANRRAAQEALATLIRRLALTEAEILALPDAGAATIESGGFPKQYDPTDRFKPFLPAGLYADDSSWICLGKVDYAFTDHAHQFRYRSPFFQFVRLPGGREETLEYIEKLNDREAFPVGTQFALIDQAFLISDEGDIVLSPLINSIQLRAYLNVTSTQLEAGADPIDCVAEFLMQPGQLMQGNSVMRAVGPKERRFTSSETGGLVDFFEGRRGQGGNAIRDLTPRLQQCTNCHGRSRSGVRSLGDFHHGDRIADRYTYEVGSPVKIARAIAEMKREDKTWKKLQELWPEAPSPNDSRR